ncbi:hypothetical protein HPB50_007840 [Hyalomma asiaticum]|uniref:Uncharacterized protein n=1 Tax=Hyalomma asiaticum TaxID=266040 RepID=A0ACB7TEB9_HYAAI|nr:hypothetical protein HPB50_007840 [Hyalomma asiaticum]
MARQAVEQAIEITVTSIKDVAVRCIDPNFWNSCTEALRTSDSEPFVGALTKHMFHIAEKCHEYEARLADDDSENPHFDGLSTTTVVFGSSPEDQDESASCESASSQSSSGFSDTQQSQGSQASLSPPESGSPFSDTEQSQGSQASSSLSPPESGSSDFDDLLELF